jgi:long-chain acyl-CoA synthetase
MFALPKELNPLGVKNINQAFERSCEKYASSSAYSCLGQTINYAELERLTKAFAAFLQNHCDLQPGDRVAVQLPNCIQYPVVAWGIIRAGFVVVNTNPLYTQREMLHQFNDAGVKALITLSGNLPQVDKLLVKTSIKTVIATNLADMIQAQAIPNNKVGAISLSKALDLGKSERLDVIDSSLDAIIALQYTGGTTGIAKGAMLTQANLLANAHQTTLISVTPRREMIVLPLPMYHIYAFSLAVFMNILFGHHCVLIEDPRDVDSFISTLKKYRATILVGINTLLVTLSRHPDIGSIDFSLLKMTTAGGAAMTSDAINQWESISGSDIYEGYGLTESSPNLLINTPDKRRLGSVGTPLPLTEIKLVDDAGNEVDIGQEGELCARGPQVMKGYWQSPDATTEAIDQHGWLKTGDIARCDEDGFYFIVDRKKDMILVSGFNVYPNEIEDVATSHPYVIEAAAVSVKDEKSGEAVKLYAVRSSPALSAETLRTFCRENLAAYKVPKYIEFIEELPKSNVGKVLRRELRAQVS